MKRRIEMLEVSVIESLGYEELCEAMLQAMSSTEKLEMLEFITRAYDIKEVEE